MTFTTEATIAHYGGQLLKLKHDSIQTKTPMDLNIFLPPNMTEKTPVIIYLAGLTCTPQTGAEKSTITYHAAKHGFAVIFPDTSPRGANIKGEDDSWDLGTGAGFYVDAITDDWKENYKMYSYIIDELLPLISKEFPKIDIINNCSLTGHSMGGYGALMFYLRNPGKFKSVSAFAPIVNPSIVPWGEKCFGTYLGNDKSNWFEYDPCHLIKSYDGPINDILIHVGDADLFDVRDGQLRCSNLVDAAKGTKLDGKIILNVQHNYDHSYYFVSSFMESVVEFHAKAAKEASPSN
ncbi:hypothetical protein CANINC_001166 [Pichia inconspicua]|uniref:S-formylglutathione hydrolase n=1 Tax=Pichia inconspicua TaxID=52247 RepID=A0A4T0X4C5_9ASCO|nr:hypothetical protein CANINC_001166 [[Candida] inconspicua]